MDAEEKQAIIAEMANEGFNEATVLRLIESLEQARRGELTDFEFKEG